MNSNGRQILGRIARRLEETGLSERAASLQAGLSADTLRSIRRQIKAGRQRGISSETLDKLAPVLSTSPEWLLNEIGPESSAFDERPEDHPDRDTIPVKGWVGAGSQAQYFPQEAELDRAPGIKDAAPATIAMEIRGTSLGELFDRWFVYFDEIRSPVTPDLIGKPCVVGLADGRVLVKKLKRAKNGLFDLISNTEDPIPNVAVEWAAKVKHMGPR